MRRAGPCCAVTLASGANRRARTHVPGPGKQPLVGPPSDGLRHWGIPWPRGPGVARWVLRRGSRFLAGFRIRGRACGFRTLPPPFALPLPENPCLSRAIRRAIDVRGDECVDRGGVPGGVRRDKGVSDSDCCTGSFANAGAAYVGGSLGFACGFAGAGAAKFLDDACRFKSIMSAPSQINVACRFESMLLPPSRSDAARMLAVPPVGGSPCSSRSTALAFAACVPRVWRSGSLRC